jgi:ABC-type amino acid transport substrate-binding protein
MSIRPQRAIASPVWLLCTASLLLALPCAASDKLVLVRPADKEAAYTRRLFELVCNDAFGRLGYDVEIRNYPPLRASREADAGRIDGEIARSLSYGDTHPALVRADEPIVTVRVAAFATNPALHVDGWSSLKGKPYRVTYRAGYQLFKAKLEAALPAAQLNGVIDGQAGMQRLALGLADLYVDTNDYGQMLIEKMPERYDKVRVAGWLEQLPLYFYLYQRHAALAPRLAAVLRQMRADGVLDRYVAQAFADEAPGQPKP